jgi:predicted nucleic acid-binding protein
MEEKGPIICDSDVLIDYFDEKSIRYPLIHHHFQLFEKEGIPVCISIITKMELIQGTKNKKEVNSLVKNLNSFNTFYLTEDISRLAFSLIKDFSRSNFLQIPDALIAATAITFDIRLYTFNKKDFQYIPGINLYNS